MKQYKDNISQFHLTKQKTDFPKIKITRSKDGADFIRQFYSDDIGIYESLFMLLLNQANNTIGFVKISQGGIAGTVCDPIIIAKYAIDSLAKGVILAHNHPSGNLQPSQGDRVMAEKVKTGLSLFDIKLLDNLILTEDSYFSFIDEGLL